MDRAVVLLESHSTERDPDSFAFSGLVGEVVAHHPGDVRPALAEVAAAVARGRHAAGFVAYEAAAGLDISLRTQPPSTPLVWFGLFSRRDPVRSGSLGASGSYSVSAWEPSISRPAYHRAIRQVREYIAAGDTYQANYTYRLRATFRGDDRALYRDLCRAQRASHCAYLALGRHRVLSASPELFFSLRDGVLTCRPMKGTRPRGRLWEEDEALAAALHSSPKDRAENVMIVDLVRNDLGRVSLLGSVSVPRLWEVERYETVWQLTSTVTSRVGPGVGLPELFAALFPCGSVTGAPKVRTMQILAELEDSPRGIYTGAVGFVSPGPECRFSVAIRTVWLDTLTGVAEYGVGGGITWDSTPEGEYEECGVKARLLSSARPEFELLETLLWEPGPGYHLLERHLERLRRSARYFGFAVDAPWVRHLLQTSAAAFGADRYRVRLLLSRSGDARLEAQPLEVVCEPLRVGLCPEPVDSADPMWFHKTTWRQPYDRRRASRADCDEVILSNERGEVTECATGNLAVDLDGQLWTPPVACGLLPGVYREELLATGALRERVLTVADLRRADALYLLNSVRRRVRLVLAD